MVIRAGLAETSKEMELRELLRDLSLPSSCGLVGGTTAFEQAWLG